MNKRQTATQECICTAFASLMKSKTLPEITVTELCEQADVNRSTFYAHYDDINELATEFCRSVEKRTAEIPHEADGYTWLFQFVSEQRELFSVYFKIGMPPEADSYKAAFFRRGLYSVVKSWFEGGCQESVDTMNRIIQTVNTPITF